MLDNPYYLAVGCVLFVDCVLNAVFEYRKWKHARQIEQIRQQVQRGIALTPRDVLDLELRDAARRDG